jgi:hypothetical protein
VTILNQPLNLRPRLPGDLAGEDAIEAEAVVFRLDGNYHRAPCRHEGHEGHEGQEGHEGREGSQHLIFVIFVIFVSIVCFVLRETRLTRLCRQLGLRARGPAQIPKHGQAEREQDQ